MNPETIVALAITALDDVLQLIAHIKSQGTLTTDEIAAIADKQDLVNLDAIKALLAQ